LIPRWAGTQRELNAQQERWRDVIRNSTMRSIDDPIDVLWPAWSRWLGWALVVMAVLLAVSAVRTFRRYRTVIDPRGEVRTMVVIRIAIPATRCTSVCW
jgi:hypothetical protein